MPLTSPLRLVQRFRRSSTGGPLQLYETSEEQKLDLLADAIEDSTDSDFDVSLAFDRLKRWHPEAQTEFHSKQQALEDAPFRLLTKPYSKGQSSKEAPYFQSFVAVSYCCRDGSWSPAEHLSTPAEDMPASPEMIKALIAKTEKNEGIWIDQCCMDPTDPVEKAAVIGISDLIYKSAREVYVLLEDVAICAPEMQMLDDFVEFGFKVFGTDTFNKNEADEEYCLAAIDKIASARWFQRAWGFHEMHCHEGCIFVITGPKVVFYRHSEWLAELVAHFNASKRDRVGRPVVRPTSTIALLAGMKKTVGTFTSLSRRFSIVDSLTCAVPSDKISMSLNLSPLQLYYNGGPKSQDECRRLLQLLALAGGDALQLLDLAQQTSLYRAATQKFHVSTTSLGIDSHHGPAFDWSYDMAKVDGIVSVTPNHLELTAYCLPQWIARSPSKMTMLRASAFTKLVMADLFKSSSAASSSTSTITLTTAGSSRILTQIIACSFECGISWIVSQARGIMLVSHDLETRIAETQESKALFDRILESGLVSYDQLLELTERNRRAVILYLYFLIFGAPLSIGRSPNASVSSSISSTYHVNSAEDVTQMQCWTIETKDANRFLLIGPEETPKHELMVLPIALGNSSCVSLPRAWYLQSSRQVKVKNWEVVSRSYLFTFAPIESILASNGQTVKTKEIVIGLE